jgi:hypothetical protein
MIGVEPPLSQVAPLGAFEEGRVRPIDCLGYLLTQNSRETNAQVDNDFNATVSKKCLRIWRPVPKSAYS